MNTAAQLLQSINRSRINFSNQVSRFFRVNTPEDEQVIEQESQNYPGVPSANINNNAPVYADPKTEIFLRDGFAGNCSIYTIVQKAASKFGHISRGVYAVKDQKSFRSYNNLCKAGLSTTPARTKAFKLRDKAYDTGDSIQGKLNDLLQRPNKWEGQDSFFEKIKIFYMVAGEAFIWLNRGDVDPTLDDMAVRKLPVIEMYVLPPHLVEIIPDLNDPWDIHGYFFDTYGVHGSRMRVRKCDIIHWKKPNPLFDGGQSRTHLRGLSPLRAGNKVLQQDNDSTDATVAMYQNGGAKQIIFEKTMKAFTTVQETALREVLDRKVNNKDMKAAVAALQGDWGNIDLGLTSVEMELLAGGEKAFVRLCNLLDMPPALFIVDQTYENRAASIKDWLTNSVIPAACSLRDEMNRGLLPAFNMPAGTIIDNDISDIPELQEDLGKMVTWMALMPWMTPNEKREYLGEEQSTEDGMDEVWIPNNLVKLSDAGMPDVSGALDAQGMNDYNSATIAPKKKPAAA